MSKLYRVDEATGRKNLFKGKRARRRGCKVILRRIHCNSVSSGSDLKIATHCYDCANPRQTTDHRGCSYGLPVSKYKFGRYMYRVTAVRAPSGNKRSVVGTSVTGVHREVQKVVS